MSLLTDNEGDGRVIVLLKLHTGLLNSGYLVHHHVVELPFADSIPVEYDPLGLGADTLVEADQHVLDHLLEPFYNGAVELLTVRFLYADLGGVATGELVHGAHQS